MGTFSKAIAGKLGLIGFEVQLRMIVQWLTEVGFSTHIVCMGLQASAG